MSLRDHQTFLNNILLKRLKSVPHTEPGDAVQEQSIKNSTSKQLLLLLGAGVISVYLSTTSASAKRDRTGNHISAKRGSRPNTWRSFKWLFDRQTWRHEIIKGCFIWVFIIFDEIFQRRRGGRFCQARIFMLVPIETSRSCHACKCRFVTHCISMCVMFAVCACASVCGKPFPLSTFVFLPFKSKSGTGLSTEETFITFAFSFFFPQYDLLLVEQNRVCLQLSNLCGVVVVVVVPDTNVPIFLESVLSRCTLDYSKHYAVKLY